MRKTIKEELEEKYIKAVLINDNALLIYTENEYDNNYVDIKLRYVSNGMIKENFLLKLSKDEFLNHDYMLQFNEEKTAIAIYKVENEELELNRLYSLETHMFATDEFLDIEYRQMFSKKESTPKKIVKKGK